MKSKTDIQERHIIFQPEMVNAILQGRKSQTRRIVKFPKGWIAQDNAWDWVALNDFYPKWKCPYEVGTVLWVRETWQLTTWLHPSDENYGYIYKASENGKEWEKNSEEWKWRPSIHMPKEACRLRLVVENVRVERLNDISEEDAIVEGCPDIDAASDENLKYNNGSGYCPSDWYAELWQKIHGPGSWQINPFVFVYEFKIKT